ncbi:RNase H domain-containing protein [Nephila pilipes]|uniref:RNase H domain-containing protein n=1 Tax=Nephila pilipes TaxID=299642 RepID=A0A8X6ULM2_NEPPI|nr:RNase H domain-containing protein [Nephila pilipes]
MCVDIWKCVDYDLEHSLDWALRKRGLEVTRSRLGKPWIERRAHISEPAMSSDNYHTYFTIFGILLLATIIRSQDLGLEENVKELLARRKSLDYVKQLVEDMDNQLNRLQKRTCYVNAGMSDSCDYKALVKDLNNEVSWSAGETPGKRKRNGEALKESHADIGRFLRSMRVLAANHKRR